MSSQSLLDETARFDRAVVQVYRYGMLVFILGSFVVATGKYLHTAPGQDPNEGFILPFVLLFGHLMFAFKWRRPVAIAFDILTFGWMIFGLFYSLYLSGVLYPVPMPGAN